MGIGDWGLGGGGWGPNTQPHKPKPKPQTPSFFKKLNLKKIFKK